MSHSNSWKIANNIIIIITPTTPSPSHEMGFTECLLTTSQIKLKGPAHRAGAEMAADDSAS